MNFLGWTDILAVWVVKGFSRDKDHASDAYDREIARMEISGLFCKQGLRKRSFLGLLSRQCAMLIVLPRPKRKVSYLKRPPP